ncbi:MAG: monovalent cation/H+ antiporter complex subunit F [Candidatus Poribacteria bacterium]|nr:monovalent cation/H+ antiporter complex subunit F [Candidatus Poribacteria bacterium]
MQFDWAAVAAGAVILLGVCLVLIRAYRGPTSYDRILSANAIGTKTVIFIALLGFMTRRPEFLDIALLYGLLNFITTIAILKFIEYKRLG